MSLQLASAKSVLINGKPNFGRVIFAHGAGVAMDSDFMQNIAKELANLGLEVIRFNFPYMQKKQVDGRRRPPDRIPALVDHFAELVAKYQKEDVPLFVAGKSMGGRVATMLPDYSGISGCFVFGYPFHPKGKPDKLRTEHLSSLPVPLHVFQGTRDALGSLEEVEGYNLNKRVIMHWFEDGDHDLKPRKSSGHTHSAHLKNAIAIIRNIIQ
ncbi:alpha/beta fold hydrolase [uncultured Neptuniibacter sp.]|uniref:alpha/beta fold hydrolase n=1 Tax=uncultured Neptuniibacter sp. TaxID=502143 RepID=UPI0026171CDA|nr:alpha/beta fold hydrolase [uncultured Neptuniibacter sp.]